MGRVLTRRLTRRQVLLAPCCALLPAPLVSGSSGEALIVPPSPLFALEWRQFAFSRGPNRPLRMVVWSPVGPGRFPLVLFSHGLHGSPERFAQLIVDIAGAGFVVVAAPAYPYTMDAAVTLRADDMPNQPADASAVISAVLGGELAGRVLPDRIGAVGHSAGGYTTAGLLAEGSRDRRVRTAVVLAGGAMNGAFAGPSTNVLFVQGDRDPIVS
jgi:alpha-beta hydrolase superfamily lysophospholipase